MKNMLNEFFFGDYTRTLTPVASLLYTFFCWYQENGEAPGLTLKDLQDYLGVGEYSIQHGIADLEAAGLITVVDDGRNWMMYRLSKYKGIKG